MLQQFIHDVPNLQDQSLWRIETSIQKKPPSMAASLWGLRWLSHATCHNMKSSIPFQDKAVARSPQKGT